MKTGDIWRVVPSVTAIMASSEGRVMTKPYLGEMPNGGEPHWGVWNKEAA